MGPVKVGDVLGIAGQDAVSAVIQLGTFSLPRRGLSHSCIVGQLHGEPIVYESTSFGRPACIFAGRSVSGVQAHRLNDFLEFNAAPVWHYALRSELYPDEADRLCYFLDSKLGLPYDLAGAVRSGGLLFNALQFILRKENLGALFCSELVAAVLVETGRFHTKSSSRWNPNKLIRALHRGGVVAAGRRLK